MKNNELLDEFTQTMADTLLEVDAEPGHYVYPMPVFHPIQGIFYLPQFIKMLFDDVKALEQKGLKEDEIAKLFKNPSRIANLTYKFEAIRGAYNQGLITKENGVEFATKLLNYIKYFREDIFCKAKKNIIWKPEKVQSIITKTSFIDLRTAERAEEIRKLIGKINAALFNICELLYFCYHPFGHECHGPYLLKNSEILVVREYYDLQNDCWEWSKSFPSNKITIFEIYKDVDIHFDFFNRYRSIQPLYSKLFRVCLMKGGFDGEILNNKEKIQNLYSKIMSTVAAGADYSAKLSRKGLLKKFVDIHFFLRKPLTGVLNKDWHTPQNIYKMIDEIEPPKEIMEAFKKMGTLPKEQQVAGIKLIFDPRIEKLPF